MRRIMGYFDGSILVSTGSVTEFPVSIRLEQNYPNPFNSSTIIEYSLPTPTDVSLTVFSILGNTVETLVDERKQAGTHRVAWRPGTASSGVYLYRLQTERYTTTRKLLLIR